MAFVFFIISIDDITIPSQKGKGKLRRVTEVFDCWFESGRYASRSKYFSVNHIDFVSKKSGFHMNIYFPMLKYNN